MRKSTTHKPHKPSLGLLHRFSFLLFYILAPAQSAWTQILGRRHAILQTALYNPLLTQPTISSTHIPSTDWQGTNLPHLSPQEALSFYSKPPSSPLTSKSNPLYFPMARWPDPVLRIPAAKIPSKLFNTTEIHALGMALRNTSRRSKAVGLAAQQCGIDASLVFLEQGSGIFKGEGLFLVNPRFVYRSPEVDMLVWEERCLVLPPQFRATVLRDRSVIIEAETLSGVTRHVHLQGEVARAVQHECQHDEGILIVDHVDLLRDEGVTEEMRRVEAERHGERQDRAFERRVVESSIGAKEAAG